MSFKFGKFLRTVALPVAASFLAPGIGTALSSGLGLGLGTVGAGALGGVATGGALGALSGGGLSGALKSAALGGVGGAANGFLQSSGGLSGLASKAGLGTLAQTIGPTVSGAPVNTAGSGLAGFLQKAGNGISSAVSKAGSGGALQSFGSGSSSYMTPLLSGALGLSTNDKTKKYLLQQQLANQKRLEPFLNEQFTGVDLENDPGYQFQLKQGQDALEKRQLASGGYFSGGALKAAQDYGQGLARTTYGDAFSRFLQDQSRKLGIVGAINGVADNIGNIKSNAVTNSGNILAQSGAGLFGGNAFDSNGKSLSNSSIEDLLAALKQRGYA